MHLASTQEHELARIVDALTGAARELVPGSEPVVVLEAPRNPKFGDFATNVALSLARTARRPPQELAQGIIERAFARDPELNALASEMSALAGFVNIRLAPGFWQAAVARILHEGAKFGGATTGGSHISLEFGSANPTGPLVVVQGRTLAIGSVLANALRFLGNSVATEWIINDAGTQYDTFGRSVYARYRQMTQPDFPFPEEGYPADYVREVATALRTRDGARWETLPESEWLGPVAQFARDAIVAGQQRTAQAFRTHYDLWQSERELHENGAVTRGVDALRAGGHTFEQDGALWLRTTDFGDDKDRVLTRSDGRPAYLSGDVAYHFDKLQRGADRIIDILGPDHHGYISRLQALIAAFGRKGALDILIAQQITLMRNGEPVAMSKRSGNVLTLDEIVGEVGVDAARFFFVLSGPDSPLTFDLSLAVEQSNENPVYYVQYGHARIASLLRKAPAEFIAQVATGPHLERLIEPSEIALARRLSEFPGIVRAVAEQLAPQRLSRYARDVAADFHAFYTETKDSRIIGDDRDLSTARLALSLATKTVLASALQLLGISAPETMSREA